MEDGKEEQDENDDPLQALEKAMNVVDKELDMFAEEEEDELFFSSGPEASPQCLDVSYNDDRDTFGVNDNEGDGDGGKENLEMSMEDYALSVKKITRVLTKCRLLRRKAELLQVVGKFDLSSQVLEEEIKAASNTLQISVSAPFERTFTNIIEADDDVNINLNSTENAPIFNTEEMGGFFSTPTGEVNSNFNKMPFSASPSVTTRANTATSVTNSVEDLDPNSISLDDLNDSILIDNREEKFVSSSNQYSQKLNLRIADAHHNLGTTNRLLNLLDKSEEHLQIAIGIKTSELGGGHESVAESMNSLSLTMKLNGREDDSKEYHRRSMRIFHDNKELERINSWWWHNGGR